MVNVGAVCALLNILNGAFFGYTLIGITSAAYTDYRVNKWIVYTVWRCQYGMEAATTTNEWWIALLFTVWLLNLSIVRLSMLVDCLMD